MDSAIPYRQEYELNRRDEWWRHDIHLISIPTKYYNGDISNKH